MAFAIFVIQTKKIILMKNIAQLYTECFGHVNLILVPVARHLFTLHNVESKKPLIHLIMNLHAQL